MMDCITPTWLVVCIFVWGLCLGSLWTRAALKHLVKLVEAFEEKYSELDKK